MATPDRTGDSPENSTHAWLEGAREMGALIRSMDWAKTPIGPIDSWSPALRMMVRFLLANRFPMLLWWGPDYICIDNDPFRPVLGKKHPYRRRSRDAAGGRVRVHRSRAASSRPSGP